jgi:hypothetical protein
MTRPTRVIRRALWLVPCLLTLALLLGGTAANAAKTVPDPRAASSAKLSVNPLSQHISNCYYAEPYYICYITLKNTGTKGVIDWFGENQNYSSDNPNDATYLYGGQHGDYTGYNSGSLKPGQKVILQIVYVTCSPGYEFWTFIFGGTVNSTALAPQASVLDCS